MGLHGPIMGIPFNKKAKYDLKVEGEGGGEEEGEGGGGEEEEEEEEGGGGG